jgi:hypothetical protein
MLCLSAVAFRVFGVRAFRIPERPALGGYSHLEDGQKGSHSVAPMALK